MIDRTTAAPPAQADQGPARDVAAEREAQRDEAIARALAGLLVGVYRRTHGASAA